MGAVKEKPAKAVISEEKLALQEYLKQVKAAKRRRMLEMAREDLIYFTQLMMPHPDDVEDVERSRYSPQTHHKVIAAALQEVEKGNMKRLIITMPPRAGKSQLAAKSFIPWVMGRDPYKELIFATYAETFAEDTGRAIRDTMKNPIFQQIFPLCQLRQGSAAADRVQTKEGGMVVSVGAGGSITGRGAHIFLIDDPIKDSEQAESPTQRNKQWDWYTRVVHTRLMTGGGSCIVIIMTRWHEDDLVGRLTDPSNPCYTVEEASKWKILALPAIATEDEELPMGRKKGEALWPDRFSLEYLQDARRLDPRGFSALYQGKPSPEDGDFFKREYISYYKVDDMPKNLRYYAASDHAVSKDQTADKTCLMTVGVDELDNIFIMPEIFWEKADTVDVVDAMMKLMKLYQPVFWFAENGHISKSIGPFLRKRMFEEQVYCAIVEKTPTRDKRTRAQSIQARMSMKKVYFPQWVGWCQEAVAELLKFPAGRHDDFVDTLAWIGIGLNLQIRASRGVPEEEEPPHGTLAWLKRQTKWEENKNKDTRDGF